MSEELPKIRNHKNYFPRQMRFVDNKGNVYEEALVIVSHSSDPQNKKMEFVARVYKSAEDFDRGLLPISESDGGVRRILFTSEAFDAFVAANAESIAANMNLIWNTFDNVKDTPQINGTMNSFFANAGEILMPDELRQSLK